MGSPGAFSQSAVRLPNDATAAREMIVEEVGAATEYVPFFDRLRATFPADYSRDLDRFAARAAAAGKLEGADAYFTDAYRALRQTRGVVAAKASLPALTRVFDAQAKVLKAMGEYDPHLCVDAIYGGATNAYFGFAAAHRSMVAEQGNASLAAVVDGGAVKGEKSAPSESDIQAVEQALLAHGLNKPEIGVLMDGKAPAVPIPDARMCAIEQTYLTVLKSLPEEVRWRIYRLELELVART